MRLTPNQEINRYRAAHPALGRSPKGANYGYFMVRVDGTLLHVIADDGAETDWEHVSVSLPGRCPTWGEMCRVKDLFWGPDETVIQFHPRKTSYVNTHPFCLHLWRKRGSCYELPPGILI